MLEGGKATRDGFLVITFREVTITPLNTTIIPKISLKSKLVTRWRELNMDIEINLALSFFIIFSLKIRHPIRENLTGKV